MGGSLMNHKIYKVLNNNVVLTKDKQGEDLILMGRGIAYSKRPGDYVSEKLVDRAFVLQADVSTTFQKLIIDIPMEHIKLGEAIVSYAEEVIDHKLNDMLMISLVDHIHTSLLRYEEGIKIANSLLWNIQRFYPKEYDVGLWALDLIEEGLDIRLPEDEAGFIALHIVNAQYDNLASEKYYQIPIIIHEITNIVKYEYKIDFDEESLSFYRFITHLNFFAQRLVENKELEASSDDLYIVVRNKYRNSYQTAEKIAQFIEEKYLYQVSNEEKMYLAIHIERIVYQTQ